MIDPDAVPDAAAPTEHHADFLELSALRSQKRSVSVQEFIRDLGIGSAEESVMTDVDESFEISEGIAQSAFDELDERTRNFGTLSVHYPFVVTDSRLDLKQRGDESLYTFLCLLSWFGKDAGPRNADGEKIFEEVCAVAAEVYLGGPGERVQSFVFGFPRRVAPKGFAAALDLLCRSLGKGGGHRRGRPKLPDQKDAKLDLVSWVEFQDFRQGKIITFGQCATGRNWDEKLSELPGPDRWCGHWMAETPTVLPLRSFFVPHRIERENWSHACTFGGILFDRCRISSLASEAGDRLRQQWVEWASHVLKKIRRTLP